MFDVGRYRSLAIVGACLLCTSIVLDVALRATLGAEPAFLEDPNPIDWNYYQLFGSSVAGAEYQRKRSPSTAPKHYGLLVGASTIERGPVPSLVWRRTGIPWLLLGIGGGTGAFSKLRRSLPLIHEAHLTPSDVFFGIHPMWLCSSAEIAHPSLKPDEHIWSVRQSKRISNLVYSNLQSARERLLRRDEGGTWAVFAPARSPWTPEPEAPYTVPQPERLRDEHRKSNARVGRFDPRNYAADSKPVKEMLAAIRDLVSVQPKVTIVLMPEHSKFRALVPKVAESILRESIARTFADYPIRIVDLRDALPDDRFFDNYHLVMSGRRELSDRLADAYNARGGRDPSVIPRTP